MSTREYDSRLVSDSRLPFDPTDDQGGALLRNETVEQSAASVRAVDLEPAYNLAAQGAYDG